MPTIRSLKTKPLRALIIGNNGSGKTGALISVINAMNELGLERIVIADWDDGLDVLMKEGADGKPLIKPEFQDRVFYKTLRDKTKLTHTGLKPQSDGALSRAWTEGVMMMLSGFDGIPPASQWGRETLYVVDTLTGMGDASMRFANFEVKIESNWRATGDASTRQDQYIQQLLSGNFHVIVNAHIRFMGGGGQIAIEDKDHKDADGHQLVQVKEVDSNVDGEGYPSALGRQLPTNIGRHFNLCLRFKVEGKHRVIRTVPEENISTLKCPITLPEQLPQETGLYTIFKKWISEAKEEKNEGNQTQNQP